MIVLDSFAQRIYDQLKPLQYDENNQDSALAVYVGGLGSMFQEIDSYASDGSNGEAGWSVLVDIERAPAKGLAWLAQFVGVSLQGGLTDQQQRDRIKGTAGFFRGTPAAMIAAAQQYLTGNRTVILRERDGGAYKLTVVTFSAQTPDSSKVLAALNAQKPAGINMTYSVLAGQDFQLLYQSYATFQNVYTAYTTFNGVLNSVPGT